MPADDVAMMPPNLSFEEAAGVPLTAITAWQVRCACHVMAPLHVPSACHLCMSPLHVTSACHVNQLTVYIALVCLTVCNCPGLLTACCNCELGHSRQCWLALCMSLEFCQTACANDSLEQCHTQLQSSRAKCSQCL